VKRPTSDDPIEESFDLVAAWWGRHPWNRMSAMEDRNTDPAAEPDKSPGPDTTATPQNAGGGSDHPAPADASEILAELRGLRSAFERYEKRRRRRMMIVLAILLTLIPVGILGAHLAIDYESGRVATTIQNASGPFTDEALARACRAIKIPLFGPETKKRLHCPSPPETTTPEPATEPPTSTSETSTNPAP
jgi:hypothetical protein